MRFHCGFSFNWKTLKKWILPIIIGVLLAFASKLNVYAETFSNNSNLTTILSSSGGTTLLSSTLPFRTSYNGTTYPNARIFFQYNQNAYTMYSDHYYDITLKINYYVDDPYGSVANDFFNYVNSCSIYVSGVSSQISDGCTIVSQEVGYPGYITIKTTNLKITSNQTGRLDLVLLSNGNVNPTYIYIPSYRLDIVAKDNVNITSQDINNAANSVIANNNQNTQNIINNNNQNTQNIINSITDTTLGSGASGSAYFGDNIWDMNYGISSLITIPINLVSSLTSNTCSPLVLSLPYVSNQSLTLPCMNQIIETNFKTLYDLYQLIIGGLICYLCGLHLFRDIETALNPESNFSISGFFI